MSSAFDGDGEAEAAVDCGRLFLLAQEEPLQIAGSAQIGNAAAPGGVFPIQLIPGAEHTTPFQGDDALIDKLLLNDETAQGGFEVVLWHR